jgi:hypothetical protein
LVHFCRGLHIVTTEKGKGAELSYSNARSLVIFFWGFILWQHGTCCHVWLWYKRERTPKHSAIWFRLGGYAPSYKSDSLVLLLILLKYIEGSNPGDCPQFFRLVKMPGLLSLLWELWKRWNNSHKSDSYQICFVLLMLYIMLNKQTKFKLFSRNMIFYVISLIGHVLKLIFIKCAKKLRHYEEIKIVMKCATKLS